MGLFEATVSGDQRVAAGGVDDQVVERGHAADGLGGHGRAAIGERPLIDGQNHGRAVRGDRVAGLIFNGHGDGRADDVAGGGLGRLL